MYKKILVPLDGSDLAEGLFPYVKELAGRLGLEMTFLYVCGTHEKESMAMYQAYVDRVAELMENQARDIRGDAGIQTPGETVKAEGKVVVGHPAEEILRCADEEEVDLLLMATHGRSGIRRWALGSVADKVLRSSAVPVWLVRANAPEEMTQDGGQISKILVSLDGSELSESVLPHIETLVKQWGAELVEVIIIMVCEPLVIPSVPAMEMSMNWGTVVEEHISYSKKAAGEYLLGIAKHLQEVGLRVESDVIEGVPADEIINYADEKHCSLIAMATHGRSGFSRWAYGSVAEKVLSGASRSVFLVRPPSPYSPPLLQTFEGVVQSMPPL